MLDGSPCVDLFQGRDHLRLAVPAPRHAYSPFFRRNHNQFRAESGEQVTESTISCPSGTHDMLDWMTMDSDLRSSKHLTGSANPLYTSIKSGKFYWTKGGTGYPWDIQLYDNNYIYLWITEYAWNYPNSYKDRK